MTIDVKQTNPRLLAALVAVLLPQSSPSRFAPRTARN